MVFCPYARDCGAKSEQNLKKLTAEEEQDIEDRTTPFGMFNMAESYWKAAVSLEKAKVKSTHADSPVRFLYYHAVELYLKSYLRLKGLTVRELASRKIGHDFKNLTDEAEFRGLPYMDEDRHIFRLMAETDAVIRSRYHRTGAFYWPTTDGLDRVCKSIREPIGQALKKAGHPVRGIGA